MLNVLELERLVLPIVSFAITIFSAAFNVVAVATPSWVKIDVFGDGITGTVSFGLIQGRDDFELTGSSIDQSYYIFTHYKETVPLEAFYVTIILLGIGILLSIPTLVLTFVNSYQVVENLWFGPPTIYFLNLATAAIEGIAIAVFMDFYLYDLETGIDIVKIPIEQQIFARLDLTSSPNLDYSSYFVTIGAILPLISVVLMWRLTALLPKFYREDVLEKLGIDIPILDFEMQEENGHEEQSSGTSSEETDNPLPDQEDDERAQAFTSGMGGYVFY